MENLTSLKTKTQERIAGLIERGKEQPDEVKTWGVTVAAGLGGAVALAAVAKGVTAVVATLASPPMALTIGALGGGALGWTWVKQQDEGTATTQAEGMGQPLAEAPVEVVPITEATKTAADTERREEGA